jgi:HPt (histidine-containing phosphotransfer) domain-containing protein
VGTAKGKIVRFSSLLRFFRGLRAHTIGFHNGIVQSVDEVLEIEQLRDVTMNDPQLMREILGALVDDTSRQLELLGAAIRQCDSKLCMRLAHYSKGACVNVGANRAAGMFKMIERSAAEGAFSECAQSLAGLAQQLEELRSAAQSL